MDHVSPGYQHDADARQPRRLTRAGLRRAGFAALLALAALAFAALGVWQIDRRAWKLELIAAVDARVHAAPMAAPGPAQWAGLSPGADAYRHLAADGRWLRDHDTLVQAVTELGAGYWVLTPLRVAEGWTVLVNRGFVPSDAKNDPTLNAGSDAAVHVTGLLRFSEPGGAFLRSNDPSAGHWYSRDVAAIAAARGIGAAPYFIDGDAGPDLAVPPVGGLTVVSFHNSHLVYAATWFSLAVLGLVGLVIVLRSPAAPGA